MKIAFLHPDLGIGGAERLVVDAALALKSKGHEIRIFTAHHDPEHCFAETKDGSLDTVVVGDWLPRSILGRFIALCSYFRMIYAAFYLIFFSKYHPDIVICDQVSACIPVLKWKGARVIFYCHFPDKLLTERKHWLKRLYRLPLDWLEEKTTGMADTVLVNSNFTAKVFRQTFPSLKHVKLEVVYPTINVNSILRPLPNSELEVKTNATTIFLSLNRYERKKNISLAIDAMTVDRIVEIYEHKPLKRRLAVYLEYPHTTQNCIFTNIHASLGFELEPDEAVAALEHFTDLKHMQKMMPYKEFLKIHLIIAGGYDERVVENQEHYQELKNYVESLELEKSVSFLKSPDDDKKRLLFHCSTAVLYTPSNEHFGIVPLEAMLLGRPVLACNSGGPLETVVHESTGFLCNATPESFAEKMILLTKDHSLARELGVSATEHVRRKFSFQNFAAKLNLIIEKN